MAELCVRLEDRGNEFGEAETARAKAEASGSALAEKVAETNRGVAVEMVDVAGLRVRLTEEHSAKAELAADLEAIRR